MRDIGEAERWIPIRVPRGDLPSGCPYCKTYSLRITTQFGRVACMIDKNRLNGDAVVNGRTVYYKGAS